MKNYLLLAVAALSVSNLCLADEVLYTAKILNPDGSVSIVSPKWKPVDSSFGTISENSSKPAVCAGFGLGAVLGGSSVDNSLRRSVFVDFVNSPSGRVAMGQTSESWERSAPMSVLVCANDAAVAEESKSIKALNMGYDAKIERPDSSFIYKRPLQNIPGFGWHRIRYYEETGDLIALGLCKRLGHATVVSSEITPRWLFGPSFYATYDSEGRLIRRTDERDLVPNTQYISKIVCQ